MRRLSRQPSCDLSHTDLVVRLKTRLTNRVLMAMMKGTQRYRPVVGRLDPCASVCSRPNMSRLNVAVAVGTFYRAVKASDPGEVRRAPDLGSFPHPHFLSLAATESHLEWDLVVYFKRLTGRWRDRMWARRLRVF